MDWNILNSMTLLAQATGKGGGSQVPGCGGGGMMQMLPLVLMFVVFYFLLIRPQQKKMKEHREMLSNLKRGDQVITNGGIMGRISGLTDKIVTIEVAEKIRVRVLRSHLAGKQENMDNITTEKN